MRSVPLRDRRSSLPSDAVAGLLGGGSRMQTNFEIKHVASWFPPAGEHPQTPANTRQHPPTPKPTPKPTTHRVVPPSGVKWRRMCTWPETRSLDLLGRGVRSYHASCGGMGRCGGRVVVRPRCRAEDRQTKASPESSPPCRGQDKRQTGQHPTETRACLGDPWVEPHERDVRHALKVLPNEALVPDLDHNRTLAQVLAARRGKGVAKKKTIR